MNPISARVASGASAGGSAGSQTSMTGLLLIFPVGFARSYTAAAELLSDVLPIGAGVNTTTLRQHVLRVAERIETELPEERTLFHRRVSGGLADAAGPGGSYKWSVRRRLYS